MRFERNYRVNTLRRRPGCDYRLEDDLPTATYRGIWLARKPGTVYREETKAINGS